MKPVIWFILLCYSALVMLMCIADKEDKPEPARIILPTDTCRPMPFCVDRRPPGGPK